MIVTSLLLSQQCVKNDLRELGARETFGSMFIFGHLGFGSLAYDAYPRKKLNEKWALVLFFLGTLTPDLIDKFLFYAFRPQFAGTRLYGHTLLFFMIVFGATFFIRRNTFPWLALGLFTHLVLDPFSDFVSTRENSDFFRKVLFWPLTGQQFPLFPFHDMGEHLSLWNRPWILVFEALGMLILFRKIRKSRAQSRQLQK